MDNKKKGVSLVTVLLFMLVATIAATATFKWLTSEGRSSSSRLMMAEARQSAVAGIESARSWMTHHGNETGAILKQYFSDGNAAADGTRMPVVLDGVLNSMGGSKQNFSVAVVGADVSVYPYKIKVVSVGESRNGTKHAESAIFNVGGLYRVELPKETKKIEPLDFKSSYHGGTTGSTENVTLSSMTVNGDWSGNPPRITENFVVTGQAKLSGSNVNAGANNCFGTAIMENKGIKGGNLYVEGDVPKIVAHMTGDVYFNGNVKINDDNGLGDGAGEKNMALIVDGNMTANKTLDFSKNFGTNVAGNFCMCADDYCEDNTLSKFDASKGASEDKNKITVQENVWIPYSKAIVTKHVAKGLKTFENLVLSQKPGKKAYVANGVLCSTVNKPFGPIKSFTGAGTSHSPYNLDLGNKTSHSGVLTSHTYPSGSDLSDCPAGFTIQQQSAIETEKNYDWYWVKDYALFKSNSVTSTLPAKVPFACAEKAKNICDGLWTDNTSSCEKTKGNVHMVQDPLELASEAAFNEKANKTSCVQKLVNMPGNDLQNAANHLVGDLNKCYAEALVDPNKSDIFFGDEYLVVKTNSSFFDYAFRDPGSQVFDGKFVFLVTSGKLPANGQIKVPPTKEDSFVFVYLKDGGGIITTTGANGPRNYFFYSEKQIDRVMNDAADKTWNGSFYFPEASCSGVTDLNSANMKLLFNENLLKSLTENGVVCSTSKGGCSDVGESSDPGSSASGSSSEIGADGYDSDFISVSPQLNIELESEYKSAENFTCPAEDCALKQSIMVMPRIIYLTQNPSGKLSDYYSVVSMNASGAKSQGNGSVSCKQGGVFKSCSTGPSLSGDMYSGETKLAEGFYRYEYTESVNGKQEKSTFYVKVAGLTGTIPTVGFDAIPGEENDYLELNSTVENDVSLNLLVSGAGAGASGTFSVDIKATTPPSSKWVVTLPNGSSVPWTSGNIYTYTGQITNGTQPVLKIHTETGARSGTIVVTLRTDPLVNCMLGGSISKTIAIVGQTKIVRGSIAEYCSNFPDKCEEDDANLKNALSLADYNGSAEWIVADGNDCSAEVVNESWVCESGGSISLRGTAFDSKYYVLYTPSEGNTIEGALAEGSEGAPAEGYKLYASLKKKRYEMNVFLDNSENGKVKVYTKSNLVDEWRSIPDETCGNSGCNLKYDALTYIKLVAEDAPDDVFNYWTCFGGASCNSTGKNTATTVEFVLDDNYSYTAHYNDKDKHCFYTDFENLQKKTWCDNDRTIDCLDKCKSGNSCAVDEGTYRNAGWMLVRTNKSSYKSESFVAPNFTELLSSNTYMYYGSGTSMILNTAEGGANGVYTTRIKTGIACYEKSLLCLTTEPRENYMVNSGLVIRSDKYGKEYILLSIYATAATKAGIALGVAEHTFARACYFKNDVKQSCKEAEIRTVNTNSVFGYEVLLPLNISFTLEGTQLDISASYAKSLDIIEGTASIDLNDVVTGGLNDASTYKYLGMKLSDELFRVGDLAWHSKEEGVECFADPTASCSFAANYAGGFVPGGPGITEEVYPWVGFSSWFSEKGKGCTISYYYNGCDMSSNYFKNGLAAYLFNGTVCRDASSEGYYENYLGNDGLRVNDNGKYNFQYEGAHGFPKGKGYVRNASVIVDCNWVNGHRYEASCGEFFVGMPTQCSKHAKVFVGSEVIYDERAYELPSGTVANMRQSALVVELADVPEGEYVSARICDEQLCSDEVKFTENGKNRFDVDDFANASGFNPEKITRVVLKPVSSATVKSIASDCPNAVGINCAAASVSYSGGSWKMLATMKNGSAAKKCRLDSDLPISSRSTGLIDCNLSGNTYTIEDQKYYDRVNTDNETGKHTFRLKVYDDSEAGDATAPADECEVESVGMEPVDITCSFPNQDANVQLFDGDPVPILTYDIKNCPTGFTCKVEATLTNGTNSKNLDPTGKALSDTWNPGTVKYGSGYKYVVKAYKEDGGKKYLGNTCTTPTFDVLESVEASATCSLSESEKKYYYTITGANYKDVSGIEAHIGGQLIVTDPLGNHIGSIALGETQEGYFDLSGFSGSTAIVLTLKIGSSVACNDEFIPEPPIAATCPSNMTRVDADVANITLTGLNVSGCSSARPCTWSISGDATASGTNYTGGDISFAHGAAAGNSKNYKLTLSRGSVSKECPFSVEFKEPPLPFEVVCGPIADQTGKDQGSTIKVVPHIVQGCDDNDCSYRVSLGGTSVKTESSYGGGEISFTGANAEGQQAYTLTIWNAGSSSSENCNFNVTFNGSSGSGPCIAYVGGASNHADNCFNTGLQNMNGKCYKCNPDRGKDCSNEWLTNNASDSYWWVETPCVGGGSTSSSSAKSSSSSTGGGGGTAVAVTGSTYSFVPGTYTITSCSGGGQLICWSPSGTPFTFTFDGKECQAYGGKGWGSCGQNTCNFSSPKTLRTTQAVDCYGGW